MLSDLEDLAEDLTERFALSMKSPTTSVRSSSHSGDSDVFGAGGELTDAPEGDYSSRRSGRPSGGSSHGSHQYGSGGAHSGGHSGFDGSWNGRGGLMGRGGGGRDDEDSDDDRRRRPSRLPVNSRAIATDSEEDTDSDDSGTDDYGDESPSLAAFPRERRSTTRTLQPPASAPLPRAASSVHAEQVEDDVPLARQIPGALKAQRTIRRQVKDELDQKRAERRAKQAALQQHPAAEPRAPTSALEPAFPPPQQNSPSKLVGRPRTKTLPSNMNSPFTPGDLTKKLLGLQVGPGAAVPGVSPTSPALPPMPASPWGATTHSHTKQPSYDAREPLASGRGRTMTVDAQAYSASLSRQPSRAAPQENRGLRPMRSFHRPNRDRDARDAEFTPPIPVPAPAPMPERTPQLSVGGGLQRSGTRSTRSESRRPSIERTPPIPAAPMPDPPRPRANTGAIGAPSSSGPSVPAPASTFAQPGRAAGVGQMWQQRVFIGNMQRFCLVEIGSATSAGDVLNMVDGQGALDQSPGSGGWMLWEVSQDFGMG